MPGGGFQTAKDKHTADLRAKGLPYPRREASGGGIGGGNPGRPLLSGPAHLATRAVLGRGRGVAGALAVVWKHLSMAALTFIDLSTDGCMPDQLTEIQAPCKNTATVGLQRESSIGARDFSGPHP